ncbi:MAG: nicotinate-nucleotide diphosphorylase (carboxylating), partial [Deltaproteobacteria bacterium]|nr:nicotinate-nucleotide diphosphorylase (carboxylating) [Deltaproteobacteria bacterium]
MNAGYLSQINKIIDIALKEDLGPGDITTSAIIDPSIKGKARLLAKEEIILAGVEVFLPDFSLLDTEIVVECKYNDGDVGPERDYICIVKGTMKGVISGEKKAL